MLATCALMGAVSLLPLQCPSKHLQEFYGGAVRMVAQPLACGDDAHTHERHLRSPRRGGRRTPARGRSRSAPCSAPLAT